MDGCLAGRLVGWRDGWMDEWMDAYACRLCLFCHGTTGTVLGTLADVNPRDCDKMPAVDALVSTSFFHDFTT